MKILIATGASRTAKKWKNQETTWEKFLEKLRTTTRTRETMAEYMKMPEVLEKYKPDYVVIRTNMAFWWQKNEEEGWFVKSYFRSQNLGQVTVEYENDTWTLLKVHEIPEPEEEIPEENTEANGEVQG